MNRCAWVKWENKKYCNYHDTDWWVVVHDERMLFEMLILEWAQAGLSWETVLNKRENYKEAFDNFDVEKVANYSEEKHLELLQNEWIIRNKLKVKSATKNACAFLEIQKEFWSFDSYIWGFVNNKVIKNNFKSLWDIPANTDISDTIAKDLKKRWMTFVGSTIMYAYMQSIWMVNDHEVGCFRYNQV